MNSFKTLTELLESTKNMAGSGRKRLRNRPSNRRVANKEEGAEGLQNNNYVQWKVNGNGMFQPVGTTVKTLEPGFYKPSYDHDWGYYLKKISTKTEGLIHFPETNSDKVISEIKDFWEKEDVYDRYDILYKRGILLYGPPGSGKSSTIRIVVDDVIERGGVAFSFESPENFRECARSFRAIQPETPLVVLMEDIDATIKMYSESEVLNILDGVEKIHKAVFLATTNYPEELGPRIINRPSRFDRRFKMPLPDKKVRRLYFENVLDQELITRCDIDIDQWVKDTSKMSIAHMRELFVSVCIHEDKYKDAIEILQKMQEEEVSSKNDHEEFSKGIGFHTQDDEDW